MIIKTSTMDVVFSYVAKVFSILYNILLLPLVMRKLTGDMLGLWYIFLNIGTISTLFSFGFNPSFARNIAYVWSGVKSIEKEEVSANYDADGVDTVLLNNVFFSSKLVYFALAFIAALFLLPIGHIYIGRITQGISIPNLWTSWYVYILSMLISLLFGYYDAFLLGIGRVDLSQKAIVFAKATQLIVTVLLLLWGKGLLSIAFGALSYCVIYRLFSRVYIRNTLKDKDIALKRHFSDIRDCWSIIKKIWPNTWKEGLIQLSSYLSTQASTIIYSLYLPLEATGVFSIYVQIAGFLTTVAGAVYNSMQPAFQSAIVQEDKGRLKRLYGISEFVYIAICLLGALGIVVLGIPVLNIIMPEKAFTYGIMVLVLFYYSMFSHHTQNASVISNFNILPYTKSFIVSSIISIIVSVMVLNIPFTKGLVPLVISQIIVQGVYNNWKWPRLAQRYVGTGFWESIKLGCSSIFCFMRKNNE